MSGNHILFPNYLRDPDAIYQESFKQIDELLDYAALPSNLHPIAKRLTHTVGRPEIIDVLRYSDGWGQTDSQASFIKQLRNIRHIFTDSEMTLAGITRKFLPPHVTLHCTLNHADTPSHAQQQQTTRSAAAVDFWQADKHTALAVIGNAPTALFRLLENIQAEKFQPLAIIAFPVGFVGAAESKDFLMQHGDCWQAEWLALQGREGGSALAAAAVNAIFADLLTASS